jgi:hypothetical protein
MKHFLVLIFVLIFLINTANGQSSEKLVITLSLQTNENQSPIIFGTVKNEGREPISDATVQISSILETIQLKSDSEGVFVYDLPQETEKINVSVKAEKEGYLTGYANTSFFIKDENQVDVQTKPLDSNFKTVTGDKIKNDPVALKILQNIELNKQKEEERQKRLQEIKEQQEFIEKQREIANQDLLVDLQVFFEQFDPFRPRNAFSTFVLQFDSTIQSVYWTQFNFTESKTKEGLAALQQVLNSGGTMSEARKVFHDTAAIPRAELDQINDQANTMYAKNYTQSRSNRD